MNVTVFGGSQPQPGDANYEQARKLGRLLAEAGHTVLTGGYMGTMEAVSRGASEAGGHVIGVTTLELESWRPAKANAWVAEERKLPTLVERLMALTDAGDAAIALPGGIGTMAEIMLLWNRLAVEAVPPKPLILVGPGWRRVMDCFFENLGVYIPEGDVDRLRFAEDVEEAARLLGRTTKP